MTEIEVIIFPVFSYVITFLFDEKMTGIAETNFPLFSKAMGFLLDEKCQK